MQSSGRSVKSISPPWQARWPVILGAAVALAIVAYLLFSLSGLVKLLLVSALFAFVLDPLACALESQGLSRLGATATVFVLVIAVICLIVFFLFPVFVAELTALKAVIESGKAHHVIERLESFITDQLSFAGVEEVRILDKFQGFASRLIGQLLDNLLDVAFFITHIIIMPFIIFFLVKDGRQLKKQIISYVPNRYFEITLKLLHALQRQVGMYLRGQVLDALIVGIMVGAAMWILDIKNALFIGAFAGIANLIPYLGPVAALLPAIAVSVVETGGFDKVLPVIVAFAVVKLIDDSAVQPVVVSRSVHLHPLVVLLVIIIGGKFFGIMGMLLAVPFTGFLKVVIRESRHQVSLYRNA